MPEPIQSGGTNSCELYASNEVSAPPPAASTAPPQAGLAEPAPTPPAVQQLVRNHPSSGKPATECVAEGVTLAAAGAKLVMSLANVVAAAPTELGLPLAIGAFIADSVSVGIAAAKYENCKDEAANTTPPK